MSNDPLQEAVNILTTEQLDAIAEARERAVAEWRQRAEAAEEKLAAVMQENSLLANQMTELSRYVAQLETKTRWHRQ